ncbi:DUF397 domain-containing protein [Streptomyces sp. NPDC002580]|uniref:DUF397 domain-containing protein n=1 Tax=Streptomyces sp. NPDC002580 TaxID=3364653 RepID=UPI0036C0113F
MPDPLAPLWFKSSYSGGSGTECVECAHTNRGTLIRDSKTPVGPIIAVRPSTWRAFICRLPEGQGNGNREATA